MKAILLNEQNLKALTDVGALSFSEPNSLLFEAESLDQGNMKYSWTSAAWEKSLLDPYLILCLAPQMGLVLFHKIPGDSVLHLLKIAVNEALRGQGSAEKLFQQSLLISKSLHSDIESVYLEVEEGNLRAIGFYKKLGFVVLHKKKGHYSDGAGALLMQKTINFF